jgi:hypothetical protein
MPYPPPGHWILDPPPPSDFAVVGTTIEIDWLGKLLQAVGVDHVDITHKGYVVYVGLGGAAGRKGKTELAMANHVYPLVKSKSGVFSWGGKAKCPCNKGSDADILDCLQKRKPSAGKNCQGDVQDAVGECCLSGFSTIVGTLFPTVSH